MTISAESLELIVIAICISTLSSLCYVDVEPHWVLPHADGWANHKKSFESQLAIDASIAIYGEDTICESSPFTGLVCNCWGSFIILYTNL